MSKTQLFQTLSSLTVPQRESVIFALQKAVSSGIDFYSQLKVAHWNMKGPYFLSLHPFIDTIAESVSDYNDTLAERAVALGGRMDTTIQVSAQQSALNEYPKNVIKDMEHAHHVFEALKAYEAVLHETRTAAADAKDKDTEDMITVMTTELEKQAWFLLSFMHTA